MYIVSIFLLVTRELLYSKSSVRSLIAIGIGLIITILAVYFAHAALFSMTVILAVTSGNTNFKKILTTALVTTIILTAIIILASLTGGILNYVYIQGDRVRQTLGFRYVLCLPTYMFNVAAIVCYLKKEKIRVSTLVLLLVLSSIVYILTKSRLTFYTTVFIILYTAFYKMRSRMTQSTNKISKRGILFVPIYIIFCVLSIYMTITYNPHITWQRELNKILGGRLSIGKLSLSLYGISLFGNPNIEWVGQGFDINGNRPQSPVITYVDNLYFSILQRYGIITLAVIIIILTIAMYKCYKINDRLLMAILITLAVHGLIDGLIQQLQYNSFIHVMYFLCFSPKLMDTTIKNYRQNLNTL